MTRSLRIDRDAVSAFCRRHTSRASRCTVPFNQLRGFWFEFESHTLREPSLTSSLHYSLP
jgi:hypothetical protein